MSLIYHKRFHLDVLNRKTMKVAYLSQHLNIIKILSFIQLNPLRGNYYFLMTWIIAFFRTRSIYLIYRSCIQICIVRKDGGETLLSVVLKNVNNAQICPVTPIFYSFYFFRLYSSTSDSFFTACFRIRFFYEYSGASKIFTPCITNWGKYQPTNYKKGAHVLFNKR